jgi:23S rRNA pseudouridine1911/1915/1917 synthase
VASDMQILVDEESIQLRVDVFVAKHYPELSRSSIQKLLSDNRILVNKKPIKNNYRVRAGDKVDVQYDPDDDNIIPQIDIPILYEDDDCIVINKPAGLLSHSKGAFNPEATVATWLSDRFSGLGSERAGIVHRLDRATSGVMICAKTPEATTWLQKQFSTRKVVKHYIAIVSGSIEPREAIIDIPIGRNPKEPSTFRADVNGKAAATYYKVLKTSGKLSMVDLKPETGRTHQLRVHLNYLGYPIVGDTLYDGSKADRMYLHALSLDIVLLDNQRHHFEAPLPKVFNDEMDG